MATTGLLDWAGGRFWLLLGSWFEHKGLGSAAQSCYRNAVAIGGNAADAAFRLSQQYLADGENEKTVSLCEEVLARFPRHARLWCALGAARRRLARVDEAGSAYSRAIEIDDRYAQAWCNLGEWLMVKGEAEAAFSFWPSARYCWLKRNAASAALPPIATALR